MGEHYRRCSDLTCDEDQRHIHCSLAEAMHAPPTETAETSKDLLPSTPSEAVSPARLDRACTATGLSRSRTLTHPVFVIALVLLVLNDHLLKHVDRLPEAFTGKLSDFAGLVVAPIVLVALLRAKSTLARASCFLLVAIVFAAINLSTDAAHLFERITALIGVPWSIVVDASDLIGLFALPLAWIITKDGIAIRRTSDRGTLVLAAIACAASSPAQAWSTAGYAINRTDRPLTIRVRWAQADLDCAAIEGRAADVFGPDIFGEAIAFTLQPDQVLGLERTNANNANNDFNSEVVPCEAVLVKTPGLEDTVVFWSRKTLTTVPFTVEERDEDDLDFDISGMLVIEDDKAGDLSLRGHDGLEISELVDELPSDCSENAIASFDWSLFPRFLFKRLVGVDAGADGCLSLDFELAGPLHVCVPKEEFPFAEGDILVVTSTETAAFRDLFMMRETENETTTLLLFSGKLESSPIQAAAIDREGCGRRLDCGSYSVPTTLELQDGSRVSPGASIESVDENGQQIRISVGTAEHVVAGAADCEAGRDAAGNVADILMIVHEVK